ncbi:hypothetical protein [Nocardia tengchongensis]|uniref:hypothetical protein n=1 Tax=Nocardia tengchongensis TaxID=2055889 RepID=UPI0036A38F6C
MKFRLTHRVSTLLATALASAALVTGAATAAPLTLDPVAAPTDPAPIADRSPTGSAGLDLGNAVLSTVINQLGTGSGLASGSGQWACKGQGGTWIQGDSTHYSYCEYPVFNPSALTIDPAPPAVEPVAAPTGSSSSGSTDLLPKALVCQLTGKGRYWSSQYGCTDVPPWLD